MRKIRRRSCMEKMQREKQQQLLQIQLQIKQQQLRDDDDDHHHHQAPPYPALAQLLPLQQLHDYIGPVELKDHASSRTLASDDEDDHDHDHGAAADAAAAGISAGSSSGLFAITDVRPGSLLIVSNAMAFCCEDSDHPIIRFDHNSNRLDRACRQNLVAKLVDLAMESPQLLHHLYALHPSTQHYPSSSSPLVSPSSPSPSPSPSSSSSSSTTTTTTTTSSSLPASLADPMHCGSARGHADRNLRITPILQQPDHVAKTIRGIVRFNAFSAHEARAPPPSTNILESDDDDDVDIAHDAAARAIAAARSKFVSGLWWLPSFINHSCVPNAAWRIVGDRTMVIHASSHIRRGEEITIPYFDTLLPLKARAKLCASRGFVCRCPRCALERSMEADMEDKVRRFEYLYDQATDEYMCSISEVPSTTTTTTMMMMMELDRKEDPMRRRKINKGKLAAHPDTTFPACSIISKLYLRISQQVEGMEHLSEVQKKWVLGGFCHAFVAKYFLSFRSYEIGSPMHQSAKRVLEVVRACEPGSSIALNLAARLYTMAMDSGSGLLSEEEADAWRRDCACHFGGERSMDSRHGVWGKLLRNVARGMPSFFSSIRGIEEEISDANLAVSIH